MKIRAIVIEDEFKVREVFINLLNKFCPDIEIVGQAENIEQAYMLALNKKPQVVFLDIEMPDGNGFDFLSLFDEIPFEIIFVTSYDNYAIRAIKLSALDYLLKPVLIENLQLITGKIREAQQFRSRKRQYSLLKENINNAQGTNQLILNTKNKIECVNLSDIFYLMGDGNYTNICLAKTSFLSTKTLKHYEDLLCTENSSFIRIHKKSIVNTKHIRSIGKKEQHYVILSNDQKLEISRRKQQELAEKIKATGRS